MRISDWSSDVCSSDLIEYLPARRVAEIAGENRRILGERDLRQPTADDRFADILGEFARALRPGVGLVDPRPQVWDRHRILDRGIDEAGGRRGRPERRHVGKEGGSTRRYRGSTDLKKK